MEQFHSQHKNNVKLPVKERAQESLWRLHSSLEN